MAVHRLVNVPRHTNHPPIGAVVLEGRSVDVPVPQRAGRLRAVAWRLASLALVAGIAALAVPAAAAPRPTPADLQRLGNQVSQLDEQLNQAQIELGVLNRTLAQAQREALVRRQAAAAVSQRLAARAAAEYMSGGLRSMSALLSGTDTATVVDRVETLDLLAQSDGDLLASATVQQRALARAMTQVRQARAVAAAKTADIARRKVVLERKLLALQHVRAQVGEPRGLGVPADLPAARGSAATAVRVALAQIGKPYHWGAAGPGSFDCSGLTMYAWGKAGVSLPHSALQQYVSLPHVARGALQPGDLVFFGSPIHHVGLYIGDGLMVAAPSTGRTVQVSGIDRGSYAGAARP
jgi:peptidoglycan DL-endopeptidase CwlO